MTSLPPLSPRESQVLHLLLQGSSTHEIASELAVHVGTVSAFMLRLRKKFGLTGKPGHSRRDLFQFAHRHGLIAWPVSLPDRPATQPPSGGVLDSTPALEASGFFGER